MPPCHDDGFGSRKGLSVHHRTVRLSQTLAKALPSPRHDGNIPNPDPRNWGIPLRRASPCFRVSPRRPASCVETECEIQEHRTDHRKGVGSVDLCSPWSNFTLCELGNCIPELKNMASISLYTSCYRGVTHLGLLLTQTCDFGVIS